MVLAMLRCVTLESVAPGVRRGLAQLLDDTEGLESRHRLRAAVDAVDKSLSELRQTRNLVMQMPVGHLFIGGSAGALETLKGLIDPYPNWSSLLLIAIFDDHTYSAVPISKGNEYGPGVELQRELASRLALDELGLTREP